MARPAEPDKRRALALRAAAILEREGIEFPVAQLALRLGIKRPTLLYHLPTYAAIFELALEDMLLAQSAFVLAEVARHTHPIDRLFAQLRAAHEFQRGREQHTLFLTQAIAATGGKQTRRIMERANQVFEAHRLALAQGLRDGMRDGLVAKCNPDAVVSIVRAMVDGLTVQRVLSGPSLDLEPVYQLVWERVLAPLKLKKKGSRS